MELASRTALGGVVGVSTNKGYIIGAIYSDGEYFWKPAPAGMIAGTAPNIASRLPIADVREGYEVFVETNKLT